MLKHFTDDNFQKEVIEASNAKPVLVDFFAAWCGPCRMQGPIVEDLAKDMGDKAVIGKLDTEEANNTAAHYGVMSIPTLMVFKGGKPVETMVGLQPKDSLRSVLEKHS